MFGDDCVSFKDGHLSVLVDGGSVSVDTQTRVSPARVSTLVHRLDAQFDLWTRPTGGVLRRRVSEGDGGGGGAAALRRPQPLHRRQHQQQWAEPLLTVGGASVAVDQINVCVFPAWRLSWPCPRVCVCVSGLAVSDEGTAGQEVDVDALLRLLKNPLLPV